MINTTRGICNKVGELIGVSSEVEMKQISILESDLMLIISTKNMKNIINDLIFCKTIKMSKNNKYFL